MSCGYKGTVLHMYEGLFIPLDSYCRRRITYFSLLIFIDIMTICPECEKEFSAPKIAFQTGQKPPGEPSNMPYVHVLIAINVLA